MKWLCSAAKLASFVQLNCLAGTPESFAWSRQVRSLFPSAKFPVRACGEICTFRLIDKWKPGSWTAQKARWNRISPRIPLMNH